MVDEFLALLRDVPYPEVLETRTERTRSGILRRTEERKTTVSLPGSWFLIHERVVEWGTVWTGDADQEWCGLSRKSP